MGLIIDTGVLIRLEREPAAVDFSTYKRTYGEGVISAATCSELLVGVHIGATAIRHGFPVPTTNAADFRRIPGCTVEALE